MYFLFQDRLVTIYQIKKTFEENHGDIFPQIVINFEFWDTWENNTVILTPHSLYWNYFVYLAQFDPNSLPNELDQQHDPFN